MRFAPLAFFFAVTLTVVGCGIEPPNGNLLCATAGKACPDNYECVQAHCWKSGTGPSGDMSEMQSTDDFAAPLKQLGEACTMGAECASAVCADSVCCNRDCSGQCEACGSDGMCNPVSGTPVSPRMPCGGTGACLGTCDGTQSTCSFPPSGTICGGACDGKCDGSGMCSGGGGTCPNGYACGVGACKTTCTSNPDCQPNFQCNIATSMCQRVPESNCLDGIDNNGDGLADCADPSCNALVQCVPDVGAGTDVGIVLATGPCPVGYDAALQYHDTLQGKACTGCTCKTKCESGIYLSTATNGTCAGASLITTIVGPSDGSTLCTNLGPYTAFTEGYSSAPVVFGCAAGGSASQAAPTWGVDKVYCLAHKTATCGANQICVPKTGGSPECARVGTAPTCPTGYQTGTNTVEYTAYGVGSCGSCGCGAGTGTCANGFLTPQLLDEACGQPSPGGSYMGIGAANCGGTRSTQASFEAVFTISVENCTTSSTNTPPTPSGNTRFCCQ